MGIKAFDAWAERCVKSMPLTCLKDSVIGVDAAYYLAHFLEPCKEPLLAALGGQPFALESSIIRELEDYQAAGFKVHFVFDGLDWGVKDEPFKASMVDAFTSAAAFETYEKDMPSEAIKVFRKSGNPTAYALFDFLKQVLHRHRIEFTVAPYSALAQLVYYEKDPGHFIDAIYGPSESFLHGAEKIITRFNLAYEPYETVERGTPKKNTRFVLESSRFSWLDRRECLREFSNTSLDAFIDACLLAGSSLLPTFPPLENPAFYSKGYTIRDVVNLIKSCNGSVSAVCAQHQEDTRVKSMDYLDRYQKVVIALKHHIIITKQGNVETLDIKNTPNDIHFCIGERLPEEISMYLSRGMLRPRVFNWMTTGKVLITAPCEGGNSSEYQNLVKIQLEPFRRTSIRLLAGSINRYWQSKEMTTKFWFDAEHEGKFNLKDLVPSQKPLLPKWHVKDRIFQEQRQKLEGSSFTSPMSISSAISSLANNDFGLQIVATKPAQAEALKNLSEITANVLWRFLQLREYVDVNHKLTLWGLVLRTTLEALGPASDQEDAAFLAIELLRLNVLNADALFPDYSGAPSRGSEADRRNCMLVSRLASLGRLRHQPTGYCGPLSRHFLAYHALTSSVQASLRDLIETCLATMFIDGEIVRDRNDWMDISLSLPLYSVNSCALGIAVKTYLDELNTRDNPTTEETRAEMRGKGQEWFPYSDFSKSLDDAFKLWDAVYKGVSVSEELCKDRKSWDEADLWLAERR